MICFEYFEEYKRLDKLCQDFVNSREGVTAYIQEMDNTSLNDQKYVDSWDVDYRNLRRARGIRNQLAHAIGTLNSNFCNENDVRWIQSFYDRILKGEDPIPVMIKSKKAYLENEKKEARTIKKKTTETLSATNAKITETNPNIMFAGEAIEVKTNFNLLNILLGKSYKGWQSCTYAFNPTDVIWMIKLNNKTSPSGWKNALTEKGERVVENFVGDNYERLESHKATVYHQKRYIF